MSLVETLRRETREAHDAIEAAVDIEAHLDNLAAYQTLLARFHGFHLGFERARAAADAALPSSLAPATSRAGLIGRDLAALGCSAGDIAALPVARLHYPSRSALLGAIYVVEGSSMGGVLIARMAAERLGLTPETGAAFFAGDGRDTARRWRSLCAALDAVADPDMIPDAVRSARDTFAALGNWLAPDWLGSGTPSPGGGGSTARPAGWGDGRIRSSPMVSMAVPSHPTPDLRSDPPPPGEDGRSARARSLRI